MLNLLATLAEYERELIVERINAGIAAARAGGTRFGRPARGREPRHPLPAPATTVRGPENTRRLKRTLGGRSPGMPTRLNPAPCQPGPERASNVRRLGAPCPGAQMATLLSGQAGPPFNFHRMPPLISESHTENYGGTVSCNIPS